MADIETLADGRLRVRLSDRTYVVAAGRPESASFWNDAAAGKWENDTFRFIDAVTETPGAVLLDVGAWIGPIALYASPRVARVVALEPDPIARGELTVNVEANAPNVEIWNAAIDNEPGELKLYAAQGLGNSETSSIGEGEAIVVKTITFDDLDKAAGDARVVLKVDIEGHEYRVMDALMNFAKRRRAAVHLSLHPRSFWNDRLKQTDWISARRETYEATVAAITRLAEIGPVTMSDGRPATSGEVLRKVVLKRRPKNFSVEVRAPR